MAAVAAGCTVAFTLPTAYVRDADTGVAVRTVPFAPYLAHLLARRADLPAALDAPRNWSPLTVAVTLALLAYYAV